jgi:NhaP-type Na+/H+ or K+/H+ antiporter
MLLVNFAHPFLRTLLRTSLSLQSFIQVFTLAFVVVGATCAIMVPIMLYMLQLQQFGWNWIHACMFGAMIASTDAVAIVSIMKTSERC